MNKLLNIFSQELLSSTPLASNGANDINDAASAMTTDDFSTMTTSPDNYLINSLTSQTNQTTNHKPHHPNSLTNSNNPSIPT